MRKLHHAGLLACLGAAVTSQPAEATFHLMQIEQVLGGVGGDATAQAIQLRMRFPGQNLLGGVAKLVAYDATGSNPVTLIAFPSNVTNGSAGSRVLVTSPGFAEFTVNGSVGDFELTNLIPASYLAAGSLTFGDASVIYWRVSWGGAAYTGSTTGSITNDNDGEFAPVFAGPLPSASTSALLFTGDSTALSTNNSADYQVTAGAAQLTDNAGNSDQVMIPPAPAASEWGLACMALMVLTSGTLIVRRRAALTTATGP